jgi:16S rRNA (cytidine1402-2'-O)-methyltransferase
VSEPLISLVATPIGNLGDISHRAVEVLGAAAVVACEDTRRTGSLLRHLGVERPKLVVFNDHTERDAAGYLIERARTGEVVAVVSDAGMPGVSDPGFVLVRAAIDAGVRVEVVPGPSAVLAALVVSGLATDRFAFDGFLPRKGAERKERLAEVAGERRTVVLYEAPHRLERTLADLATHCGDDRLVAVARELTKLHEEVWRGALGDSLAWAAGGGARGEIVIVVDGATVAPVTDGELEVDLSSLLATGSTVRDAAEIVAAKHGVRRGRAYDLALSLRRD